jgi:rhamnose utilization protein RhaD (predicted bifunctional aldolase and dehydrogenase)
MNTIELKIDEKVKEFCSHVGQDPMLVQGAGGNVSWKDGDVLWVKASGTWLADAKDKNIFVPIQLPHLRQSIAKKDFHVIPKVLGNSKLKPSIETLLHALMPHKVVVHLHAIEILAHLVRFNPTKNLQKLIGTKIMWSIVDYFKPGAELARAVSENLLDNLDSNVIFLCNHGVVIGGESVKDIEIILEKLIMMLKNPINKILIDVNTIQKDQTLQLQGYTLNIDKEINQLATNKFLSKRLRNDWTLYPDHAVFLGDPANILGYSITSKGLSNMINNKPTFIFDESLGVYESDEVTLAQKAQLQCYYDVLIRQPINEKLVSLSQNSINELLQWDAEKYRQLQSE